MKKQFQFIKEPDEKWYVVLPEWQGEHENLEMVYGADTMLDILSNGRDEVKLTISDEPFENYGFQLIFDREDFDGAFYKANGKLEDLEIWLCQVTTFVFGGFPNVLYIK